MLQKYNNTFLFMAVANLGNVACTEKHKKINLIKDLEAFEIRQREGTTKV